MERYGPGPGSTILFLLPYTEQNHHSRSHGAVNEAIALFIATLPTVLFPLFLFVPTWLKCNTWQHQEYNAVFQGAPFLMVMICVASVALMMPGHGLVSKQDSQDPNVDTP
jgi:uncharacterized membrane protein